MSKARSPEVGILAAIVHLEDAAGHLMDTVVDSLVGVEHSLHVRVLDGEQGT
jgi:hypothetical protein